MRHPTVATPWEDDEWFRWWRSLKEACHTCLEREVVEMHVYDALGVVRAGVQGREGVGARIVEGGDGEENAMGDEECRCCRDNEGIAGEMVDCIAMAAGEDKGRGEGCRCGQWRDDREYEACFFVW